MNQSSDSSQVTAVDIVIGCINGAVHPQTFYYLSIFKTVIFHQNIRPLPHTKTPTLALHQNPDLCLPQQNSDPCPLTKTPTPIPYPNPVSPPPPAKILTSVPLPQTSTSVPHQKAPDLCTPHQNHDLLLIIIPNSPPHPTPTKTPTLSHLTLSWLAPHRNSDTHTVTITQTPTPHQSSNLCPLSKTQTPAPSPKLRPCPFTKTLTVVPSPNPSVTCL